MQITSRELRSLAADVDDLHNENMKTFAEETADLHLDAYKASRRGFMAGSAGSNRENTGSRRLDFRISRYAPAAYVGEHVHQVQEQVYYVLEGEGILTLDDDRHLMRPNDYVYVPPGIRHSFTNTGTAGLVFLVITTPAIGVVTRAFWLLPVYLVL